MSLRKGVFLLGLAGVFLDCTDEGTTEAPADVAQPGFLSIELSGSSNLDGAIRIAVESDGLQLDSMRSLTHRTYLADTERELIVVGLLLPGELARFWVPDQRNASSYSASTIEVAGRPTYEQLPPADWPVTLAR